MPTSQTRHYLFITAALLCFLVGFLLAIDVFDGDQAPWLFFGLTALAAERLP